MALRSAKVDGLQLWVTWWNISSSLKNKSERVRGREERCENRREKELHSQFYNSDPKDSELVGVGGGDTNISWERMGFTCITELPYNTSQCHWGWLF